MLHKIQITIMILIIPLGFLYWYLEKNNIPLSKDLLFPGTPIVHLGDIPLQVEIADSSDERERGMSGRKDKEFREPPRGMLFVFDTVGTPGIWMKDMNFPIDIIWINEDLKIVAIDRNVSPDSYPKTYRPPEPIRYVVETYAGYTETFGISAGKSVTLPLNLRGD